MPVEDWVGLRDEALVTLLYGAGLRISEALGLRLMSINVSSILMPMVFGTVGTAIGVASVFWAVSAGVLGCTRAAWKLKSWSRVE